jgi:lysophospholipase L1-like esterase
MAFAVAPGSKIVFTGDSITDCGRRSPAPPLGSGYVQMAADLMRAAWPGHDLTILNTGIGGNTIHDLYDRWTDDVIRHKPDWISILIGINDISLWLSNQDRGVSPELFEQRYDYILSRVKKEISAKLVLADPFYISRDDSGPTWRSRVLADLPKYHAVVEKMVARYQARHVRYHQMFQRQIERTPPEYFCPEPVHPNASGHLVMAHEWLKTMGCWEPRD